MKTLRNHVISKIIITLLILGLLGCGLYTDRQIMLTVICIGIVFLFVFEIVSVLCFTFFAPLLLDMMLLFSCNDPSLYFYICWNKLGRYHEKKREKNEENGYDDRNTLWRRTFSGISFQTSSFSILL